MEETLLLGERLIIMAPRLGRILLEFRLSFAGHGVGGDLRAVRASPDFVGKREEVLSMIWGTEDKITGRAGVAR